MIPQNGTLEFSRSRLRHNLNILKRRSVSTPIAAVVKADAYGHGESLVVAEMLKAGVDWFCFYSYLEAAAAVGYLQLAVKTGNAMRAPSLLILSPIRMLNGQREELPASPDRLDYPLERVLQHGMVRFNVTDIASAEALHGFARDHGSPKVPIHVQIDAGLTRAGVHPADAPALLQRIAELNGLRLEGVFAHFSHGDEPGHPTLAAQMQVLGVVAEHARKIRPDILVHIQNSGGVFNVHHQETFDMVRVGIALYGLQPSTQHPIPELLPIARLTAPILAIHERPAGTGVGYGHTFVTRRASRLAIVPVGYADGYPRGLSNRCVAQVRDVDVPVAGRVSMDQIILDITDLPASVGVGEIVTVISNDPAKLNCVDRMADTLGTIGYEIATHFGSRLNRVVVD